MKEVSEAGCRVRRAGLCPVCPVFTLYSLWWQEGVSVLRTRFGFKRKEFDQTGEEMTAVKIGFLIFVNCSGAEQCSQHKTDAKVKSTEVGLPQPVPQSHTTENRNRSSESSHQSSSL